MALTKNRQYLGHRWVEVYAAKKEVSLVYGRRIAERHVRPMAAAHQLGCICSTLSAALVLGCKPCVVSLPPWLCPMAASGNLCTRQGLVLALLEHFQFTKGQSSLPQRCLYGPTGVLQGCGRTLQEPPCLSP